MTHVQSSELVPTSRVIVGVVLVDASGGVLMQLRDDRPDIADPGLWTVPGGGAEPNETLEEAARRELLEETGYAAGTLIAAYSDHVVVSDGLEVDRHFFAGRYDGRQAINCFEGQQVKFMNAEARADLQMTTNLESIINVAIDELSGTPQESARDLPTTIERYLVCPRCHNAVAVRGHDIMCSVPACGWHGVIAEDIAVMTGEGRQPSYFDDKTGTMRHGFGGAGTSSMFYARQGRMVSEGLAPGALVVDVGCGPLMPYTRGRDQFIIGVDLSWQSLRENDGLDLRVYGSGAGLPLADRSVDTVVAMYAIHHFAGNSIAENERIVRAAFSEFGRVLKPGGELLVFENSPRWPFNWLQLLLWNLAKRLLGPKLDMFFWSARSLLRIAASTLPHGSAVQIERFDAPWWTTFPPVFALPFLRVPRFVYPFDVRLYRWVMP